MSARLNPSHSGRNDPRPLQEEKDRKDFATAAGRGVWPTGESHITQAVAARQPPPIAISDLAPEPSSAEAGLFDPETEALSAQSIDDVTGDLAEIYLTFADEAKASGNQKTIQAFDFLGELMLQYEHVRMMRTRDLG